MESKKEDQDKTPHVEIAEEILPPPETTTILVEDGPALKRLLTLNLEIYTATKVINKYNADDLVEYLKRNKKVDLIICKNMIGKENTILKTYYYVNSNRLKIPIILLGNNPKLHNEVQMIDPSDWKTVIKTSAKLLNVKAQNMIRQELPDYFPIETKTLLILNNAPIDIMKQCDDGTFEVLYKAQDKIDKSMLRQIAIEGCHFLYIKKKSRLKFAQSFSNDVQGVLQKEMTDNDRIYATGATFSYSKQLIATSGLNERAVEMAQTTIGSMLRLTESSKDLAKLLEIISESEEGYLYKHSVMIAIIASNVISKMEWGSKSQKESICFMAFFHDITIPDDDLCQIQSNSGLEKAEVSEELKNKVKNHARDAKELITSYPNVPYGAESFILQHHGMKTGIGFSDNPTDPNISPMAIVFKMVEEYVDVCIHPPKGGIRREEYIGNLKKIYKAGQYRKVVEALEQVILDVPKKEDKK